MEMKLGHFSLGTKKQECSECHEKFHEYGDLVSHVRLRQHGPILRCHKCGQEFVKESDRYHHLQEEKAKKLDYRRHR
jgi:predicted amidophosphoribosyltransferase